MNLNVKLLILIFVFMNSFTVHAEVESGYDSLNGLVDPSVSSGEVEEFSPEISPKDCDTCFWSPKAGSTVRDVKNFEALIQEITGASALSAISERLNWGSGCDRFAVNDKYGDLGKFVIKELESNKYDELMRGTSDLRRLCRGYDSLTREGKQGLWVTILSAMANHESTCRPNPPLHRGPNGTLVGILQLHLGKEDFYTDNCKKLSGQKPQSSLQCSMAMLNDQVQRDGKIFSNKSYWEVLRPNARRKIYRSIQLAVSLYPTCR